MAKQWGLEWTDDINCEENCVFGSICEARGSNYLYVNVIKESADEGLKESFENGVDDYIKKPFDLEELDQRILKLCRQFLIEQNDKIKIDENIFFESQSCQVYINDKIVNLAQKERDILKYFCTHKNRVVSSDELLQNIWAYDEMPTDATIRVYIKNLREIIGKDKITTIRGIGYRFE